MARGFPLTGCSTAFVRLTTGTPGLGAETRRVVLDGLRGAAEYGTASAFRERGISALAKTGTAAMPGGGFEGLLVAVTPADAPTKAVVVMAPGGAGLDAARIAAEWLRPAGIVVRVGMVKRGGYDVTTMGLEEYVGRVVSAEAAAGSGLEARKALAIAVPHVRRAEPRPARERGVRSVRPDALPGRGRPNEGRRRGRRGDTRPGPVRVRPSGRGLLHRVVRRSQRAAIGRVARGDGSGLPAREARAGVPRRPGVGERRDARPTCSVRSRRPGDAGNPCANSRSWPARVPVA